jgi:DNA-binding transcriptional MerR regulator
VPSRKKRAPVPGAIPDKPYFKIGEVAAIAGVEPYVLRYWESEFKTLRPEKSRTNQRRYRRKDVEEVLRIRSLVHEQGFRIAAARKKLRELDGEVEPGLSDRLRRALLAEVDELEKILDEDESS